MVEEAKRSLEWSGARTVLFIDEVHRFSKTQQDSLLAAVENRWVSLVAATTENPSFSVVAPLLSRSLLLTLRPLDDDDVREVLRRALADAAGLRRARSSVEPEAEDLLVRLAGGRRPPRPDLPRGGRGLRGRSPATALDVGTVERAVDRAAVRYDRDGDQHYDVVSAWIKSMRGSDPDAALHYLARMIEAGEDPRFLARRLVVHASEDVGLADPTALQAAVAAAQALDLVGLPEARLALAQATLHIALAPKSNAVTVAYSEAAADVRDGRLGGVPAHLRDAHYPGAARARARPGLPLPARRPGRGLPPGLRPRAGGGPAVLPPDRPWRRASAGRAGAAAARPGPGRAAPAAGPGAGRPGPDGGLPVSSPGVGRRAPVHPMTKEPSACR